MEPGSDYPPPPTSKVGLGQRFLARVIDALVLVIPILLVTVPIGGGYRIGGDVNQGEEILAGIVGLLISFAYFVVLESTRGATVGKSAMGIEINTPDGQRPTPAQAAQRNAWMLLSVVPGAIGGLLSLAAAITIGVTIAGDERGRGVHDRWADLVPRRY